MDKKEKLQYEYDLLGQKEILKKLFKKRKEPGIKEFLKEYVIENIKWLKHKLKQSEVWEYGYFNQRTNKCKKTYATH